MTLYEISVQFHKELLEIDGNRITIGVISNPVKGQANKEIIKKLSRHFGIPASQITIKSGHKSNKKIIEILNGKIWVLFYSYELEG